LPPRYLALEEKSVCAHFANLDSSTPRFVQSRTLMARGHQGSQVSVAVNRMWWLTFLHGGVVIVEATSLIHARTRAVLYGLGRASHFAEGHFIEPERTALIPYDYVGRMLYAIEARQLRELLARGPGQSDAER
jgi:hypothetical protein